MREKIKKLLNENIKFKWVKENLIIVEDKTRNSDLKQVQEVFSKKWGSYKRGSDIEIMEKKSKDRFLKLYGFSNEQEFEDFIRKNNFTFIYDAGCGRGHKSAWIAGMKSDSLVVGVDISDSVVEASLRYRKVKNLVFIKADITKRIFKGSSFDFIICDQVLHHTKNPPKTLQELSRVLKKGGWIFTYVYAKKAIPRELIDEYFRKKTKKLSHQELLEFSEQITMLGKILSELKIKIKVPDIPLLGIKGGEWDLQRFIYYNFIKCYWNEEAGWHNSVMTNYDWYSPKIAFRYSEDEFKRMIKRAGLKIDFLYKDEMASYSARLKKE